MIDTPIFRPHLNSQIVPPDRVFLTGEGRQFALTGAAYVAVAPLIDGKRTTNEIIETLIGRLSATESAFALLELEKHRYIEEAPKSMPVEQAAFWSALDVPVRSAEVALNDARVAVTALGGHDPRPMVDSLSALGIDAGAPPLESDLHIVIADDYLNDALADINREAVARGRPWLLVQPNGRMPLIGPLFAPGTTGCWACLEQRLRANREVETFLERLTERRNPQPARASLPASVDLAHSMAATLVARVVVQGAKAIEPEKIRAIDAGSFEIHDHILTRRPQCPVCGDPLSAETAPPAPVRLQPVRKVFTVDGGHRASTPDETLRRYRHHISPITGVVKGLTRITDARDPLQHVYISGQNMAAKYDSYHALKQNIRGSSCGKGVTDAQAQVSALCEAIERYSGVYRGEEHRIRGSLASLGAAAVDPRTSMLYSEQQYRERDEWNGRTRQLDIIPVPFDPDDELDWTPVWSLTNETVRYLPTSYLFYSHPTPFDRFYCPADSNGCAAGNTIEEAVLQGFLELIERDSVAIWWYNRLRRPELDLDAIDIPYLQQLRAAHRGMNRHLWVLDVTADFGIPTFIALSRRTDKAVEDITFAPAAHFDARIALLRALTELNQMIPGVVTIGQDGSGQYAYHDPEAQEWWRTATIENQPYVQPADGIRRTLEDYPEIQTEDLKEDIDRCRALIEARGLEFLVLDQTRPDIGVPVAKVIVPGLRHFWARYAPGRLYDVPVELGWRDTPLTEADLNPITMFI